MRPPLLLLSLCLACAPDPTAPVRVMGLVENRARALEPRELSLRTVSDVVALEGTVATFRGGARIVFDVNDPQLGEGGLTEAQLAEVFLKSKGLAPRASYVEKDGVLWPTDFHSWNMVTAYALLERTFDYFQATYDGQPTDALLNAQVYYFPSFVISEVSAQAQVDNAIYFSPVQGFALLPFDQLDAVPLALNAGVWGHEYAHRVFNQRAYGTRAFPEPFLRWDSTIGGAPTPALNALKAIDEGYADFHGYSVTCGSEAGCDPRFLAPSLGQAGADERDLSRASQCLSAQQRTALETLPLGEFISRGLHYQVGSAVAAALFQAGNKTGKLATLQKAVVASYADATAGTPGVRELIADHLLTPETFRLELILNALLAQLTDLDLATQTCSQFLERLRIDCNTYPCPALPACPAGSVRGTTSCPL